MSKKSKDSADSPVLRVESNRKQMARRLKQMLAGKFPRASEVEFVTRRR